MYMTRIARWSTLLVVALSVGYLSLAPISAKSGSADAGSQTTSKKKKKSRKSRKKSSKVKPAKSAGADQPTKAQKPADGVKVTQEPASDEPAATREAKRIAIIKFAGPEIYDIDTDEIWKLKTKLEGPKKSDLSKIASDLQEALTLKLKENLGSATVVPKKELTEALSHKTPEVGAAPYSPELASELGARYFVIGTINRIEFDGNTVLPDRYDLTITMHVVDGASGNQLWSMMSSKYGVKVNTKKSGKSVYANFKEKLIPDVVDELSSRVAAAIGR